MDEHTTIEVVLPDGTRCTWSVMLDDIQQDTLTSTIENLVGPPDTILC